MAWWSNDGNQNFTKFNLPAYAGALWLDAADLDMDGDMDMYGCGMSASTISWWENDGLMNFTKHNLPESFPSAFAVWAMDMDYDTDLDLVCIGNQSGRISWFENQLLQPSLFYHPEGIVYDHANSRYLVSNTCGVDSTGSILQLTLDMQQSVFIPGIEDPLGMYLTGDTLLVSHAAYGVVGYDVNTGDSLFGVPIYPTGNADGMTCDNSNHLYVLDTYGKLHRINLQDLSRVVLVSGGMGSWPQDCVYDPFNDRILVAPFGQDASIYSIDPETGEVTEATTTTYGRFDGINIDTDGNVYLSTHYSNGYVIKYDNDLTNPPEILSTGNNQPAGNCYNPYDKVLAVANFGGNSVSFIPLTTTGGTGDNMEKPVNMQMKAFPNPCSDHTIIEFSLDHPDQLYFRVLDVNGKILFDDMLGTKASGYHSMKINTEGMASGVYYCVLRGNEIYGWHKMLVK
jgi:DNA-binding beta-propeller fold protein YncE